MKTPPSRTPKGLNLARGIAGGAWDAFCRLAARLLGQEPGRAGPGLFPALPPSAKAPEGRRIYAIGDVHGRADLLDKLVNDIARDAAEGAYRDRPILVFLGDYVDRGLQSKDVIDLLLSERLSPFETYFLKGNHEAALLQFLDEPSFGPRWCEFGGAETLVSYGVRPPRMRTATDEWTAASKALHQALPPQHLDFLRRLKLSVRLGDYLFAHAGVRPGVDLALQSEQDLLWIREDFLNDTRRLGAVVVHGHTPAAQPHRDFRRIGIDTGAYLSGRLAAARFEHDTVTFLSTGADLEAAAGTTAHQEIQT